MLPEKEAILDIHLIARVNFQLHTHTHTRHYGINIYSLLLLDSSKKTNGLLK